MTHNTFDLRINNTKLFGQYWKPETIRAVIVLVHGMGEHASRYEDFVIPKLLDNDFAVVAYDNFGHGRSDGKRGHCPNYEALMESVEQVINMAENLFPNTPKFLYGHSMGGNLTINYALRKQHSLKGVIATSPFLRLAFQPPKWKLTLGKIMMNIWPSITLPSELEVEAISRDPKEVKRYVEDALVHDKVSPMFTFPIMDAGEWAIKQASKLKTPILLLHGTGDRIIDHKASEEFSKNSDKAELKLFEDGYHELHHDLCKDEFMETIVEWLNKLQVERD